MTSIQSWRTALPLSLLVVVGVGVLAGCTAELKVAKLEPSETVQKPGWTYSLPFARYDVVITRRLTACNSNGIEVDTAVTGTEHFERDPAHTYVIDHRTLSNAWKTSDLSVVMHPNGMLQSISSEARDEASQIIISAATGVATIATSVATGGIGSRSLRTNPPPSNQTVCSDATIATLAAWKRAAGVVERETQRLAQETGRLNGLSTVATAVGDKLAPALQREFKDAVVAVDVANRGLKVATGNLSTLSRYLTDVKSVRWPNSGRHKPVSAVHALSKATIALWLKPGSQLAAKQHAVVLALTPSLPAFGSSIDSAGTPADGIRYRVPARGKLLFCQVKSDVDNPVCLENKGARVVHEGSVPQFGRVHILPYRNGPFQANLMTAAFLQDGSLVEGGYKEKSSIAAGTTATLASLAELGAQTAAAIKDRRKTKLTAQKESVEAETALLAAQSKLEQAKLAAKPSPTEKEELRTHLLQAETTLLNAEKARIEAELALAAARENATAAASK